MTTLFGALFLVPVKTLADILIEAHFVRKDEMASIICVKSLSMFSSIVVVI